MSLQTSGPALSGALAAALAHPSMNYGYRPTLIRETSGSWLVCLARNGDKRPTHWLKVRKSVRTMPPSRRKAEQLSAAQEYEAAIAISRHFSQFPEFRDSVPRPVQFLADCVGPANIFAFEPAPTAFERLTENWRLNGWDTLRLVQAAVGGEPGWAYVDDVPHPTTTNRVYATALADSSVRVPLVRLDDFREHLKGRPVGLLKIDVEGFEGSVLRGAYRLLLEDRPRIVMFESLDAQPTPAVETILKEADYVIFQLDSGGRPDFSTLSNQNLFAIPAELRGSLAG